MAREEQKQEESLSRKHQRSSEDEEIEKNSKRHKHRRHKHRHRRHRSRSHREEKEYCGDGMNHSMPVGMSNRADDDVEEGEILEEGASGEDAVKKAVSEDESGEIKSSLFHGNNPPVGEFVRSSLKSAHVHHEESANVANRSCNDNYEEYSPEKEDENFGRRLAPGYKRGEKKGRGKSSSPSRQREKKLYYDNDKMDVDKSFSNNTRSSFSSDSDDKCKEGALSPHLGKDHSHVRGCSKTRSRDIERGRSHSRSAVEEEDITRRRRHRYEREASRDRRNVYGRHAEDVRHHNRGIYDRERSRERDLDREHWREIEKEGSKVAVDQMNERRRQTDLDRGKGREREVLGRRDRDRRPEKDRDRSRDRDWKREVEKDREGNSYRFRYPREERERERQNEKSKDRVMDIEREREKHKKHRDSEYDGAENDQEGLGKREYDEQYDSEENLAWKPAEQEEEELNRIKEESRKRRQAILEKYKNQQMQPQKPSAAKDIEKDNVLAVTTAQMSDPMASPKGAAKANLISDDAGANTGPGMDVENITIDDFVAEPSLQVEKSPSKNGILDSELTDATAELGEGAPKSERATDTPCDDIFGDSPAGVRKMAKGEGVPNLRSGLHDNWDDAEGYYSYQFGELLNDRYEVIAAHGKGVFSTVVRAKDVKAGRNEPEEVAIKIIRNNETMHKSGQTEVQILKKLAGADREDRRHCVRFLSSFKYRNHLCLVFESLNMNLRELLKKFGRNIGLKLTAVRAYAKQLFVALKHLKNCGVLHCDIKPDNMLVNEAKNVLKLCDFGNAMFAGKNEITPYLVSRFYRAPEIILGLSYDHPLDMWSVGCCLYELYSGKVLFPGRTNNDMLRLQMELKGPFPKKMLRKGAFTNQFFDHDLCFHAMEEDPVTGKMVKRMIVNVKPKDIGSVIKGYPGEDPRMLANFKDLLDKIFTLDPERRLTVSQALAHPFIIGK